ncbi:MAG: YHS domain-containing protein, partial [Pyrinomonadaceae bacterium]|nr:YHS domain-containing protein [Pyrinomonadaceae bacterium]
MTKTDPICGMAVDTDDAAATAVRDGEKFYFCSKACSEKFAAQSRNEAGTHEPHVHPAAGATHTATAKSEAKYKDPVCGMMLDPENAAARIESEGEIYYFCSDKCKLTFESKMKAEPAEAPIGDHDHPGPNSSGSHDHSQSALTTETIHKDPVCGMVVDPTSAAAKHDRDGTTYYFCSDACFQKFEKDPDQYLKAGKYTEPVVEMEGVEYTCPMHPEIVQDKPGSCPICGMALEPRMLVTEEDTTELDYMSKRFWVSAVLAIPVFVSAMAAEFWPERMAEFIAPNTRQWVEMILATPAVLWGGWPFYVRCWQ